MSSRSLMHRVFPPSKPPDGGYPPSFRLIVGGTQLRGSWYLSAIVWLQGFSSCSPVAPLRRRSPKTVTTSPWVGRSKPGCDLGPTLSFEDVHHPRWCGGRAEPELYLPRGFVGRPLLRCSRERALTGPAGGPDFDNAGLVDGGRRHPQRVELVGLASGGPSCRKAAAAPCAREDRPRRRTLLGRRSCSGVVLPLHRYGTSARGRCPTRPGGFEWGSAGGLMASAAGAEVEAAREVPVVDGITATIRASGLRLFVLVLAPRASAWVRARLQQRPPRGLRRCSSATRSGGRCRRCQSGRRRAARQSSVAPQALPHGVGLFVPAEGEPEFRL
jgi:hypothetical protein